MTLAIRKIAQKTATSVLLAGIFCMPLAGCQSHTTIVKPTKVVEVPDHNHDHQQPPPHDDHNPPPPPPPHHDHP